jgi:hypothetical protein
VREKGGGLFLKEPNCERRTVYASYRIVAIGQGESTKRVETHGTQSARQPQIYTIFLHVA